MAKTNNKSIKIDPMDLEIIKEGNEYILTYEDERILTESGHQIRHSQSKLIELMISEFEAEGLISIKNQIITKPKKFSAYALYGIQKQFIETKTDNLTEDFEEELSSDPILFRAPSPDIWIKQTARYNFLLKYLSSQNQNLPTLTFPFDDELRKRKDEEAIKLTRPSAGFVEFVRNEFESLPPHRKVVTVFLHNINSHSLLSALMLAKNNCTASQYANAVITATVGHTLIYGESQKNHQKEFAQLEKEASTALAYIEAFEDGDALFREIKDYIQTGENGKCEFKSCKRRDVRDTSDMWFKRLRSIVSFLNTSGGVLLIGVENNGEVTGIEEDYNFQNDDIFLQTLANKIESHIKPLPVKLVETDVRVFPYGKSVCLVRCKERRKPTKLIYDKKELFLVRTLNKTTNLTSKDDEVEYIKELSQMELSEFIEQNQNG